MPKVKKVIKKKEQKKPVDPTSVVETTTTIPKDVEVKIETSKVMPMFEGKQVLEILDDGMETETAFHCRLSDQTTAHVPKKLFE